MLGLVLFNKVIERLICSEHGANAACYTTIGKFHVNCCDVNILLVHAMRLLFDIVCASNFAKLV